MLQGLAGHLISEHVLERSLGPFRSRRLSRDARRRRAGGQPAALVETSAEPAVRALRFQIRSLEFHDRYAWVLLGPGAAAVGLLVCPFGERLDALWRTAVVKTRSAGGRWCLLFNVTHLRIVDAARLHSRRYAEVFLDAAATDPRVAAALRRIASAQALDPSPADSGLSR